MTRRFDIGPVVLALAALVLLVSLFLSWTDVVEPVGTINAWEQFEITDLLLAALGIAAIMAAVGLLVPDLEYVERRYVPWIVGAAFLLVVNNVLGPTPGGGRNLGTGAWLAFGATAVMVLGAVLSLARVSFAVAVEGRDRRRRVSAVDHRPPPTETGAPVARSSTSLLRSDKPEAGESP